MRSISRINASTIASRWKNASIIGNMWPSTGQVTLNVSSLPMPATLRPPQCVHILLHAPLYVGAGDWHAPAPARARPGNARGLARRNARRFDHVTLTRGDSSLGRGQQYACGPLASRSKLQPTAR